MDMSSALIKNVNITTNFAPIRALKSPNEIPLSKKKNKL